MRNMVIFRSYMLAISETFVKAQADTLTRYRFRYAGLTATEPSLVSARGATLLTRGRGSLAYVHVRWYRLTGLAPEFHQAVRARNPELIHAHFAPDGVMALPLAASLKVPLVVTLHGFDVTVKDEGRRSLSARHYRRARRQLWQQAARFLCVSEFIRAKALEAGFPAEKLEVHYIGIDRERFALRRGAPAGKRVLFVGRMVEKKGLRYLVEAMAAVQARHPDAVLTAIGTGPEREQCQELAKRLSVRCEFLGSQSSIEVRRQLESASVFCLPSVTAENGDSEGLPIVILEALAVGVPVVASCHAGIPEAVLDGRTGLLAEERNPEQLAAAICRFLEDAAFAEQCRVAGAAWVQDRFDLAKQTALLEAVYDGVLSASAGAGVHS